MRIIEESAAVLAYDYELDRHWERLIAAALGDRGQSRAAQRRLARVLAAALMGVIRAILQEWAAGGGRGSLRALGEEAFALLNQGVSNHAIGREGARGARKS